LENITKPSTDSKDGASRPPARERSADAKNTSEAPSAGRDPDQVADDNAQTAENAHRLDPGAGHTASEASSNEAHNARGKSAEGEANVALDPSAEATSKGANASQDVVAAQAIIARMVRDDFDRGRPLDGIVTSIAPEAVKLGCDNPEEFITGIYRKRLAKLTIDGAILRLAKMNAHNYEMSRKSEAKRLRVRVEFLDRKVSALQAANFA